MPIVKKGKPVKYLLNENGEFIIENYNYSKPLANFFPGIAGKYGIPMWVFYVNRGQAISSFGTDGKDHAILEFQPANKSWQTTPLLGFRTFIKVSVGKKEYFYEPFHPGSPNSNFEINNKIAMSSFDLKLEEQNKTLGLKTNVEYFTIPHDSYAGLVRIVTLKNTSQKTLNIELLDGLPAIVPYGITNLFLKKLHRTIEAWMKVENLEKAAAFYKVDVDPTDQPQIIHIEQGNFYLGFYHEAEKAKILKPIVDPESIFGRLNNFFYPAEFLKTQKFKYPPKQQTQCKTPCGFIFLAVALSPQEEKTFYTVIGNVRNLKSLNLLVKKVTASGYLLTKKEENKKIIKDLQDDINTQSSSWKFDYYCRQTYLDNIIRGGYPIIFQSNSHQNIFYLYSRKHGDLERDYNKFQLEPTYFSQGNGNYRDINQNRRCDIWFNPQIKDHNLITFFNLLQADGFNPLVVKGITFSLKNKDEFKEKIKGKINESDLNKILLFLEKPFTPGEVMFLLEESCIHLKINKEEFLNILLSLCTQNLEATHGEGFWTDHWSYNLDLLESYLEIYPEALKEIVFVKKAFTFYNNTAVVKPRRKKYILLGTHPRQLHSVEMDEEKREMFSKRLEHPHLVRAEKTDGEIYKTTVINKLFCLLTNKLASLDPFGCGIEMEANKPNWFDALNGLPSLFGSSSCETFELKRLLLFLTEAILNTKIEKISLSEEIYNFFIGLASLIKENLESNSPDKDFQCWDKSYTLKEKYRELTKFGFSGRENEIPAKDILDTLELALKKIEQGLEKAFDTKENIYYGYFINEVKEYNRINETFISPRKFEQKKLPFFLEGQVHALRLSNDLDKSKALYKAVKQSQLYDRKLKMYKVTSSLKDAPEEIGRCHAFTPGWLENESIWLHMEYKYLLEVLEKGLYEEFYSDFKNVLIPFLKPQIYGRSILENSSFLVSSAFPYKELHGNGFVARLSGSTAEFLHIWLLMNMGKKPFFLNEKNELNLKFSPVLAGWLFRPQEKTYSFKLFSKIQIVYHNPKRKNTFGKNSVRVKKITFIDKDDKAVEIFSDTLPSPYAEQIRSCQIQKINIDLS